MKFAFKIDNTSDEAGIAATLAFSRFSAFAFSAAEEDFFILIIVERHHVGGDSSARKSTAFSFAFSFT